MVDPHTFSVVMRTIVIEFISLDWVELKRLNLITALKIQVANSLSLKHGSFESLRLNGFLHLPSSSLSNEDEERKGITNFISNKTVFLIYDVKPAEVQLAITLFYHRQMYPSEKKPGHNDSRKSVRER